MKTVVFAYHTIGCVGIRALLSHGFDIAMIITHTDSPDETIWFESVAELAAEKGIPVYAPSSVNHPIWIETIRKTRPDVIFSFYFRDLLCQEILDIPEDGAYNLHGSLLPAYRGRCPINWVLVNGETRTGVTLHRMVARADAGDIAGQEEIPIAADDTALTLHRKAAAAAGAVLDRVLPALKRGNLELRAQNPERASCFGGRRPADGEIDWSGTAASVRNLVRAVTHPYPGAFSFCGSRKFYLWKVSEIHLPVRERLPGTIVSVSPLVIACGRGAVRVETGQAEGGPLVTGAQMATDARLTEEMTFGPDICAIKEAQRKKRVLILGVNGFIGNALSERLLETGRFEVHGMDISSDSIERLLGQPDFYFHEGDIGIHREWIEYHVKKCDIVLPLVAIATPAEYTRNPLRVFELDFEENLRIVRYCARYGKRILFPSTSEVYGMCDDETFDEDESRLVLGPVSKQRWIYSCSKQLLDRVIYAYGQNEGLKFTIFRPFNWIGPRLDSLDSARVGSSRAITQLILNLVEGTPIQLVDGGLQKRCFTDISDGVECLLRIIEDRDDTCNGRIINIGNPENEASIRDLAGMLVERFETHPMREYFPPLAGMREVESSSFYGKGYEDVLHRKPSIKNARQYLGWEPVVPLKASVDKTLDFFLGTAVQTPACRSRLAN